MMLLLLRRGQNSLQQRAFTSLRRAQDTLRPTRYWSAISLSSTQHVDTPASSRHNNILQNRRFGLSRHPDPLSPLVDLNTVKPEDDDVDDAAIDPLSGDDDKTKVLTADELEYASLKEATRKWVDANRDDDDDGLDFNDFFSSKKSAPEDDNDAPLAFLSRRKRMSSPAEREYREKQAAVQKELDSRTGRLWEERWVITDEEWMSTDTWEDIEEWSLNMVTRKSLESVRVWDDGVPTLEQLSTLPLPPSLQPHPGHGTPALHAAARKKHLSKRLRTAIQLAIADDLKRILALSSWEEKQEGVDALFEVIEERVRDKEPILAKLPDFSERVVDGLEQVLRMVRGRVRMAKKGSVVSAADASGSTDGNDNGTSLETGEMTPENIEYAIDVMEVNKEAPVPIFMDLLKLAQQPLSTPSADDDSADNELQTKKSISEFFLRSNEAGVPNLVYPLNVHHNEGTGRMVEEWELAANKETKRIMMRDGMKEIARRVVEAANCCGGEVEDRKKSAVRVFVTGKRGVGKTATLAGLVASARVSGHIVVYLPDGDRLRKHGFYIEPCPHRKGLYNLPEIAKEFCEQLLTSHGNDLCEMSVTKEDIKEFLSEEQINRLFSKAKDDSDGQEASGTSSDELSLDKILNVGMGSTSLSSGCYGAVISALMNQKKKPFTVVMDEFNCYYDHGHYFHMDYDENVRKAIPINKITIFKPFMDAMGLYPAVAGNEITKDDSLGEFSPMMNWGSIIVGMSESRAVRQSFTQALTESARALSQHEVNPVHVVDLQRFNDVEVQHILYNFEITGIGRLRFDRGYTTLNPEEVEYLRMVSGGLGQPLLDACMLP
ncbi:hypothetical protein ACHAWX_007032 [Stephanocyclus meneghinianus]